MKIFNIFKKKKEKKDKDFSSLLGLMENNKKQPKKVEKIKEYHYKKADFDFKFKLGDKVLTKSNECDPYMVGEIVEFWNNNGKWENCIPQVKDKDGKIWGIMGVIRPYSKKLEKEIKKLKPLEQWNYFVPSDYQYSKKEILKKEKLYEQRKNTLEKVFKN